MKVLQLGKFYPPARGGIETHLQVLCQQLKNKVDLQVLVASKDRTTTEEVIDGVAVRRLSTAIRAKGTSFCPSLAWRIRQYRPDLLHIHLPNPAAVVACFASGYSGPIVATYHSDIVRQKVLGAMLDPLMQRFLKRCASILVSSPKYLDTSLTLAPHRDRVCVAPFGIPLQPYLTPDRPAVERLRRQYGARLILAVGRLVYYKGFEHLVRAMASVDGTLLIVGEGPLRADLLEKARAAGISSRIVLLGGVTDRELTDLYAAADVFVLPSIMRSEAFGLVQIEAMASGKPVINTNIDSGVPFVSIGGQTGITVPPGDSGALASGINLLLDDEHLRARLGVAARQRAREFFSAETMASRILEIYQAACGDLMMAGQASSGRI